MFAYDQSLYNYEQAIPTGIVDYYRSKLVINRAAIYLIANGTVCGDEFNNSWDDCRAIAGFIASIAFQSFRSS